MSRNFDFADNNLLNENIDDNLLNENIDDNLLNENINDNSYLLDENDEDTMDIDIWKKDRRSFNLPDRSVSTDSQKQFKDSIKVVVWKIKSNF